MKKYRKKVRLGLIILIMGLVGILVINVPSMIENTILEITPILILCLGFFSVVFIIPNWYNMIQEEGDTK